ncbi:hypothetical protein GUITHDRAFT_153345 [Guillardia theta CCMP2712]|uniref:Uncharacterized protein n=1 Tax=Guillardia theta (strain CCMP2712) TaxID=905079 RepID=L1J4Q5_GUITC|nr:hypothetical protein GUITHDRAFT_153345 [Guillardia theta CCMP2712]EKX43075.1 hypothetical protein GUITHDRAFT_153345 [Guillardia theta CCMP2712]|eukprot:XP_005830055.1 hypothetical protein GUITHDRAFT_153345 [Guillardia theta CCMP2712]
MTQSYGSIEEGKPEFERKNFNKVIYGAIAAVAAVCVVAAIVAFGGQHPKRSSLLAVRLPNGRIVRAVPVQQLRIQKLFGPGDLPIPIEDDGLPGGDAKVVPGSNVHLFEHFAPPQPYGMDNRRDPPYDTSFGGMGFGSDY